MMFALCPRTRTLRFILLIAFTLFGLTSLLNIYRKDAGPRASDFVNGLLKSTASNTTTPFQKLKSSWDSYFSYEEQRQEEYKEEEIELPRKANAAIVMLARNTELEGVVTSMKQLEDRFNNKFNYPWIFLNDKEFTDEFKKRTAILTNANVSYGLIPEDHWKQPSWINEKKAAAARKSMMRQRVLYAGSVEYRNMCRFNSGFFFKHELLKDIRYYWRVEPDVRFFCDIDYDPFLLMQDEGKVYGFTMALREIQQTVATLWQTVKEFTISHPEYVHPENGLGFLSHDGGETYNLCHWWSNFEIADMDFWRGEAYSNFFEHLDRAGGFYYERWGDAPVHSIAAGLFLSKHQLHFFSDIGYKHSVLQHCPQGDVHTRGKCWCNYYDNFDYQDASCLRHFDDLFPNKGGEDDIETLEQDDELPPVDNGPGEENHNV